MAYRWSIFHGRMFNWEMPLKIYILDITKNKIGCKKFPKLRKKYFIAIFIYFKSINFYF
jgi:hypothetical protein